MVDTKIPDAPRSIAKGSTLKDLLDREAIDCLVINVGRVYRRFDGASFRRAA